MNNVSGILLMAGNSNRFDEAINKTLYEINNKHLFLYSLEKFNQLNLNKIYLVTREEDKENIQEVLKSTGFTDVVLVKGGKERQDSVKNALKEVKTEYVLIHDSARPLTNINDIKSLYEDIIRDGNVCGSMYHDVTDTIKEVGESVKHLDRSKLKAVTTPQIFKKDGYLKILSNNELVTDELSIFNNENITFTKETTPNIKVTTKDDLDYVKYLLNKNSIYKIGHSYDYHNFKDGEKLILGGINIPSTFGLDGYSDADVVYHSVCEAILGALGMGDIGTIFPDNVEVNFKRNSLDFVSYALTKLKEANYEIVNLDMMIYLQKPNLKDYKVLIAQNLKEVLQTTSVNVKATTLEKQGLIGTCQGIGTETVILIKKTNS